MKPSVRLRTKRRVAWGDRAARQLAQAGQTCSPWLAIQARHQVLASPKRHWDLPGERVEVDVFCEGGASGVDAQDVEPVALGGRRDVDEAVKTAGAQEGRVQRPGTVGRRKDHHARGQLRHRECGEHLTTLPKHKTAIPSLTPRTSQAAECRHQFRTPLPHRRPASLTSSPSISVSSVDSSLSPASDPPAASSSVRLAATASASSRKTMVGAASRAWRKASRRRDSPSPKYCDGGEKESLNRS